MMSDQANAMIVIGSSHSRPVSSLFGNIACGKTIRMHHCERRADRGDQQRVPRDADMRLVGMRELLRETALQPKGRKLRGELDDQHRISKAAERLGAVDAAGDEQERQARGQPDAEAEEVDPSAAGQRREIGGRCRAVRRRAQCAAPQCSPQPISTSSGTSSLSAGSAAVSMTRRTTRGRLFLAAVGHLEHQFVMDLQEHAHVVEARLGKRIVHPRHRALDDVGAGALDRRVDRRALGPAARIDGLGERMFGRSASCGRTGSSCSRSARTSSACRPYSRGCRGSARNSGR